MERKWRPHECSRRRGHPCWPCVARPRCGDWAWSYFGKPNELFVSGLGAVVVAGIATLIAWRNEQVFTLANEVTGELRKVTWPTGKETVQLHHRRHRDDDHLVAVARILRRSLGLGHANDLRIGETVDAVTTGEREGKSMAMKWYVVHTYSGHENKARLSLQERVKQMG